MKIKYNDEKVSEHFKAKEFLNPLYTKEGEIDEALLQVLEKVRTYFNKPVFITPNGGYRTESQNRTSGGAKNSYHLSGKACDVYIKGIPQKELAFIAFRYGANGIIIYDTFTHIDVRDKIYLGGI